MLLFPTRVPPCQGDIPLSKIKFDSKKEYDYVSNFKILQTVFNNHGVNKVFLFIS